MFLHPLLYDSWGERPLSEFLQTGTTGPAPPHQCLCARLGRAAVGWWMEREKEIGRGVGYGVNVNVFVCVSRKGLTSSENNSHQL